MNRISQLLIDCPILVSEIPRNTIILNLRVSLYITHGYIVKFHSTFGPVLLSIFSQEDFNI